VARRLSRRRHQALGNDGLASRAGIAAPQGSPAAIGLYVNSLEEAWYGGHVGDGSHSSIIHFAAGHLLPAKFFGSIRREMEAASADACAIDTRPIPAPDRGSIAG